MTPEPKAIKTPSKLPPTNEEVKHIEVSGGLYTKAEVEAWEKHLEQSGYHNQILHKITQGVCLNEGHCEDRQEDSTGYDLNLLKKPLEELRWFQELQKKVQEHTAILCVAVLTLEAFKLVSSVTAIIVAMTKEGIIGVTALLWACLCPLHHSWTRMKKRAERRRRNQEENKDDKRSESCL